MLARVRLASRFRDKWSHYVQQWQQFARSKGRTVEFHYMGKSEILEALSREEHAGRFRWWFERPLLSRRWLDERLDEVIEQVGPRYNHDLTVGVPAGRKIANFARFPHLLVELYQHAVAAVGHVERLDPAIDPTACAALRQLAAALPTPLTSNQAIAPVEQLPVGLWLQAWQDLQLSAYDSDKATAAEPAPETPAGVDTSPSRSTTHRHRIGDLPNLGIRF